MNQGPLTTQEVVAYRFFGPVSRGRGWCTAACDYDVNGVCRKCECLDPERFVVTEYPTKEQDAERREIERLLAAGIDVRLV